MNNIKNEYALTLLELLAYIALFSIISLFSFSLITQSMENTQEIQIENQIRDEADLIVSSFMKTLYETKQAHIIENYTDAANSYLNITTDPSKCQKNDNGTWNITQACKNTLKPIGFKTVNGKTHFIIYDETYEPFNEEVYIQKTSRINGNPGNQNPYELILFLGYTTKRGGQEQTKSLTFTNVIQPY